MVTIKTKIEGLFVMSKEWCQKTLSKVGNYIFKSEYKKFTKWCQKKTPKVKSTDAANLDTYIKAERRRGVNDVNAIQKYVSDTNELLTKLEQHPFPMHINFAVPQHQSLHLKRETLSEEVNVNIIIHAANTTSTNITLTKLSIHTCDLKGLHTDGITIIDNCKIKKLTLSNHASVYIKNTLIGKLYLNGNSAVEFLDMEGGCLLDINCPVAAGTNNPFNGSVTFENVFLPRNSYSYLIRDAQPYRNVRHYLREIENNQMSNLFHSAEMAMEREEEPWSNKIVSYMYEYISDFGASWSRPVLWFILLTSISIATIYHNDGAITVPHEKEYIGWLSPMNDNHADKIESEIFRSIYLGIQPIYNPLGLFNYRALVIPKYGWIAFLTWVQSILSIVFIALTIFSLRRRFKIQN